MFLNPSKVITRAFHSKLILVIRNSASRECVCLFWREWTASVGTVCHGIWTKMYYEIETRWFNFSEVTNRKRERERVNEREHWLDRRCPNDTMMMMMMYTCCSVRGRTAKWYGGKRRFLNIGLAWTPRPERGFRAVCYIKLTNGQWRRRVHLYTAMSPLLPPQTILLHFPVYFKVWLNAVNDVP